MSCEHCDGEGDWRSEMLIFELQDRLEHVNMRLLEAEVWLLQAAVHTPHALTMGITKFLAEKSEEP